jgi:AhpD family alkylhydroperoxidase
MKHRFHYARVAPGVHAAMHAAETYLSSCGLEESLIHLVRLRASQINRCANCIDMHWKDLRTIGEEEQRLYSLDGWRECPFYTERERAALEWTEALTRIAEDQAPHDVFERVRHQFPDKELADLTITLAAINSWNHLSIAARTVPGSYMPARRGLQEATA